MLSSLKSKAGYVSVKAGYEEELKLGDDSKSQSNFVIVTISLGSLILLSFLFLSSIISSWIVFFDVKSSAKHELVLHAPNGPSWVCQRPEHRREWRALSKPEKLDYVTAVQCLATKPSKLRNNGTLYDDFPWVHKHMSSNTHVSAPFLPWHRYYIHLYEKTLKEACGFSSSLPYWDWSLDWSNFRDSPVWDSSIGLGGDGSGSGSVGDGKCVTSGPFSEMEVMFYDNEVLPHCLSRGFPEKEELKGLGELIRPEAINDLMKENAYEDFASQLEKRAHQFLSHSVRGDLSRFTGPNGTVTLGLAGSFGLSSADEYPDPVFFLHHVNLDRLWSQWQQSKPLDRVTAYHGRANNNTEATAALTDVLDMGGLSTSIRVLDVMETTKGPFCYGY